jgi:hypothetical protein
VENPVVAWTAWLLGQSPQVLDCLVNPNGSDMEGPSLEAKQKGVCKLACIQADKRGTPSLQKRVRLEGDPPIAEA